MAKRRQYLFVCTNRRPDGSPRGSCAARGSEGIFQAIRHGLVERGLAKTEARVCQSSCLDLCDEGPIVLVEPEHRVYTGVTLEQVPRILDDLSTAAKGEDQTGPGADRRDDRPPS